MKLRAGLVLAIEPMLHAGGDDDDVHDPAGWTLRTADAIRAAHAEHTVAITPRRPAHHPRSRAMHTDVALDT